MSRPIFHELQIEAVQHGADRDAEKHSKNAEHLAVLPPAHNVPSGGRADIDCKEVLEGYASKVSVVDFNMIRPFGDSTRLSYGPADDSD